MWRCVCLEYPIYSLTPRPRLVTKHGCKHAYYSIFLFSLFERLSVLVPQVASWLFGSIIIIWVPIFGNLSIVLRGNQPHKPQHSVRYNSGSLHVALWKKRLLCMHTCKSGCSTLALQVCTAGSRECRSKPHVVSGVKHWLLQVCWFRISTWLWSEHMIRRFFQTQTLEVVTRRVGTGVCAVVMWMTTIISWVIRTFCALLRTLNALNHQVYQIVPGCLLKTLKALTSRVRNSSTAKPSTPEPQSFDYT